MGIDVQAGWQTGDVFREYKWRPEGKWQRVTGPDATHEGAQKHLPNDVNVIVIDDLDKAIRIEAYVEMLLCHGGTANKRIRVNGSDWIVIPESKWIPGDRGEGEPGGEYQYMRYPEVVLPMGAFGEGENTFEFTCSSGTSLGKRWPQWIVYGVTFRVYYAKEKAHPGGQIVSPQTGATLGESPAFEVNVESEVPVRQVDVIGEYEDFNWEGDGQCRQWHYLYAYGEIDRHIGTAIKDPYRVVWDTEWIPSQSEQIRVCARIVDETGLCFITPVVDGLQLKRAYSVKMYEPHDVPLRWSSRAGKRHACKIDIVDDLSQITDARIVMSTWNGVVADDIGVNDVKVTEKIGMNHDLSYDVFSVPTNLLRSGENTLYTFSDTHHHGIEVQWPGMVLFARFSVLEGE